MFGPVGDHLLCCQLGSEEQTHHIDRQQVLVVFVREFKEGQVSVYPGAGDADVEGVGEIGLEGFESIFKRFLRGYVDSEHISS